MGNPEILVFGAKLKCQFSDDRSHLLVNEDGMTLGDLPEACVADSEVDINIPPFGHCKIENAPCETYIELADEWDNPSSQHKTVNGKAAITMDSVLMCLTKNAIIEPEDSGQDGEFAELLRWLQEIDEKYPGLLDILLDPYGSLYLDEGMYQMALDFLTELVDARGGTIMLAELYGSENMQDALILSAIERLLPYCDCNNASKMLQSMATEIVKFGGGTGAIEDYLDANMLAMFQKSCDDYNSKVAEGGFYYQSEKNKKGLSITADIVYGIANARLLKSSMTAWKGMPSGNSSYNKDLIDAEVAQGNTRTTPDFVVTPKGEVIIVPKGAYGPVYMTNSNGRITGYGYTGGNGGANGQVTTVRIMNPNSRYPNGYVKYSNSSRQGVLPDTGKTGSHADTHFPLK